jgi:hypothetical protein
MNKNGNRSANGLKQESAQSGVIEKIEIAAQEADIGIP